MCRSLRLLPVLGPLLAIGLGIGLAVESWAQAADQAPTVAAAIADQSVETIDCGADAANDCVSPSLHIKISSQPTFSVAVFPVQDLMSVVDPEVAHHLRQRVEQRLVDKGYTVIDGSWIDETLRELGLTHADELSLVPLTKLGDLVPADAFVFGLAEVATTQHAAVFNRFVYKCSFKMQTSDGAILWYSVERKVSKHRFALDPINAFLDIALTKAKSDVKRASYALVDGLLASLPAGPVQVVIGDDMLNQALQLKTSGRWAD